MKKLLSNLVYRAAFLALPFFLGTRVSAQITLTLTSTNPSCFGYSNGSISAHPTGGVAPYSFLWSNGASTQQISTLPAGTYSVTVTDANLNLVTAVRTLVQPAQLGVTLASSSQLCEVAPDGSAFCVPYSGTEPYQYQWSNGGTGYKIDNLTAGTYTVTVSDGNSCTVSGSVSLNFWNEGIFLMQDVQNTECGYHHGSITATPLSGTAPYAYHWSNGDTLNHIDNLPAGTYTVTVSDAHGCSAVRDRTVEVEPFAPTQIVLTDTFCLDQNTLLQIEHPADPVIFVWDIYNPFDQIIQGQFTDSIIVDWVVAGDKRVTCTLYANGTLCNKFEFLLNVADCAGTAALEPENGEISVTPNPFSDLLQVDIESGVDADLTMTDVSGRQILQLKSVNSGQSLQTDQLPPGIYWLNIRTGKGIKTLKLLKNNK